MKYLGINSTKEVKDLYKENIKQSWKKLKEDLIDGKLFSVNRVEELILLKYPCYPMWPTDSVHSV